MNLKLIDVANVLTIGYGSTKGVTEDMEITQEEAETLLQEEMHEYEGYINDMVKVPLEQHQFDAMVSWVFNLGSGNLSSSTLLRVLNEGKYEDVPEQIKMEQVRWQGFDGLVRRRTAEFVI